MQPRPCRQLHSPTSTAATSRTVGGDFGLNLEELQAKFSGSTGEHEYHTRALWQSAVEREATKQDYWAWVMREIAKDDIAY